MSSDGYPKDARKHIVIIGAGASGMVRIFLVFTSLLLTVGSRVPLR